MTLIECARCNDKLVKSGEEPPSICGSCRTQIQERINQIERRDDRYTNRGKIKNVLKDIPSEALPEEIALQAEEVANPEIDHRTHCKGKLSEMKIIGDDEIHDPDTEYRKDDKGKLVLKKKRYR